MTAARPIRAHAGTVEHRAIIDDRVPPLPPPHPGRAMCAAWTDHRQPWRVGVDRLLFCPIDVSRD